MEVTLTHCRIMEHFYKYCILSALLVGGAVANGRSHATQERPECPQGWNYVYDDSGSLCIGRIDKPLPYKEAQQTCRDYGAFLINLDLPLISQIILNASLAHIKDNLFPEVKDEIQYWTGLHYDGEAFVWDGMLPSSPRLNLYCNNYGEELRVVKGGGSGWLCEDLPAGNITLPNTCVATSLVDIEAIGPLRSELSNVSIARLLVAKCEERQRFICAGRAREYCEETGWMYSSITKSCLKPVINSEGLNVHFTNESVVCKSIGSDALDFNRIDGTQIVEILSQIHEIGSDLVWAGNEKSCSRVPISHCCTRLTNEMRTAGADAMFLPERCETPRFFICEDSFSIAMDNYRSSSVNSTNLRTVRPLLTLNQDGRSNFLSCEYGIGERPHIFLTPTGEVTTEVKLDHPPRYDQGGSYKCAVWVDEIKGYIYSPTLNVNNDGQLDYFTVNMPLADEYISDWYGNLVTLYPVMNDLPPFHSATLIPLIIKVTDYINTAFNKSVDDIIKFVECGSCLSAAKLRHVKLEVLRIKSLRTIPGTEGLVAETEVALQFGENPMFPNRSKLAISRALILNQLEKNLFSVLQLNSSKLSLTRIEGSDYNGTDTLISEVTVSCQQEIRHLHELNETITLPKTEVGGTIEMYNCSFTGMPIVTAECVTSPTSLASWKILEINPCSYEGLQVDSDMLRRFMLNFDPTDSKSAIFALGLTTSLTSKSHLSPADLALVADLLTQLTKVKLEDKTVLNTFFSSFVDVIDNVMMVRETENSSMADGNTTVEQERTTLTVSKTTVTGETTSSADQEESVKTSRRILAALNDIQYVKLPPDISASDGDIFTQSSSNVALKLTLDSEVEKLVSVVSPDGSIDILPATTGHSGHDWNGTQSKLLDLQLSEQITSGKRTVRKSIIVYGNDQLHKSAHRGVRVINKIAAVSLATFSGSPINVFDVENAIQIRFLKQEMMYYNQSKPFCGYWVEETSDWSGRGCTKTLEESGDVLCTCDHLTAFSVILAPSQEASVETMSVAHAEILTIISIIGLSISSVSLCLVLFTAAVYKRLRKYNSQKVLICLSVSLLGLNLTFLFGVDRTNNLIACFATAIILHYFLLASFSWMMVEAVLQYLRFVKVLGTYIPRFMIKSSLTAFGIPAAIVGTTLAVDFNFYKAKDSMCWLQDQALYYSVLVPISIVLIFNTIIFALVLHGLLSSGRRMRKHRVTGTDHDTAMLHLRVAIATFVILGLTWIFGFLALIKQADRVFQYLFCIFNSLQGLLIFVFHNIKEKSVQAAWVVTCQHVSRQSKSATSTDPFYTCKANRGVRCDISRQSNTLLDKSCHMTSVEHSSNNNCSLIQSPEKCV